MTIEYTLEDKGTGVTATITKHIPSISFAAGQHHLISHDLDVMVFDDRYYMWDAQQEYWYDYKRSQPRELYGQNDNYPRRGRRRDAQRIYSTADFPSQGSASARNNPNVNEAHWYVEGGNAHWDDQTVWSGVGHLYRGGVSERNIAHAAIDSTSRVRPTTTMTSPQEMSSLTTASASSAQASHPRCMNTSSFQLSDTISMES